MSHRSFIEGRPNHLPGRFLRLVLSLILLMAAMPAYGQLSDADISALQQQAIDEGWTFTISKNPATDRLLSELCGIVEPANWRTMAPFNPFADKVELPPSFDWRAIETLPPPRDQGQCGSCWAFATVGALECNIAIQDGLIVDLSEQWLVSCNLDGWSCDGGWFAHDYHQWKTDVCDSTGAPLEVSFPYTANGATCTCYFPHPHRINSWAFIGDPYGVPSVEAMKQAIMDYGPISVCVTVNSAFQAYNDGVFNSCTTDPINHAVVLVGWDDALGTSGAWIMRNSWGAGWGESGYMYIEYGCSNIGYGACYVDYWGGVIFEADTTLGELPLPVNFTASTGLEALSWAWDFGDGGTSDLQSPSHTYEAAGVYDVTASIETATVGTRSRTKYNYIVAYADTMKAVDAGGTPGSQVEMIITANNTAPVQYIKVPVEFSGDFKLSIDSFSTVGCRTSYFEIKEYIYYDSWNSDYCIRFVTSTSGTAPDLPAGQGPVCKLYLSIPSTAEAGQSADVVLDGFSTHLPGYYGVVADYSIPSIAGQVSIATCVPNGDVDNSGGIDIADLVYLVEYMFNHGAEPVPVDASDLDCSGGTDIADLVYLVDYMFNEGPDPCGCP